jgi:putative flippase GtrA
MNLLNKTLAYWFGLHKKFRYILVGGYNTTLAYGLFVVLELLLRDRINYILILCIVHFITTFHSFVTFRIFVFRSRGYFWKECLKINISYFFYLVLNIAFLFFLKTILGINLLVSQVICVVILTGLFYYIHEHFSFKI